MTTEYIPDYASCTLRELCLVLNNINPERVPATHDALRREIESRTAGTSPELLDAWRALDRSRFPEMAARLEQQIAVMEREEASRRAQRAATDGAEDQKTRAEAVRDLKYATFWRRFFAGLLDAVFVSAPLEAIGTALESNGVIQPGSSIVYDSIAYAVLLTYYIALHARYGQTLGKKLLHVKVLDKSEARGISLWQAIRRDIVPVIGFLIAIALAVAYPSLTPERLEELQPFIAVAAAFLIATAFWFVLELVTMLFNRKRRAVQDLIAGTIVVRT